MRYYLYIGCLISLLVACDRSNAGDAQSKPVDPQSLIKTYTIDDTFENTLFNLKQALTDRGLVVNTVGHISDMLQRTGKALGKTRKIFTHAQNIEFCSATLSRNSMSASPHNIIYCPYIISVYSLAGNPKKTYVSYRRLPRLTDKKSDKALQAVNKLLDDLAKAATQ